MCERPDEFVELPAGLAISAICSSHDNVERGVVEVLVDRRRLGLANRRSLQIAA